MKRVREKGDFAEVGGVGKSVTTRSKLEEVSAMKKMTREKVVDPDDIPTET